MCGIAGYIGKRNAPELLFDMLKCLEYRGYDSAGLAYISNDEIFIPKAKGRVDEVRKTIKPETLSSNIGVGHTRWATHGPPSNLNSHPHADCTGKYAVAHNGIIENFMVLKQELEERGHVFKSDTDTEVISHLIEEYAKENDFFGSFREALLRLRGSFAIAAISTTEKDKILVARKESPLIIGVGIDQNFLASDLPAILPETKDVIILDDFEYGYIKKDEVKLFNLLTGEEVKKEPETTQWDVESAEKGGFHHFMLKEIYEEPNAVRNALREKGNTREVSEKIKGYERIYFVACGTASYAGLVGKYLLEHFQISSESVVASEFRYSTIETIDEKCLLIAVSQSGETADTLAAVKESKKRGAHIVSIVNAVGSSLTREAHENISINAGPEIAVASTKAYVGQVVSLTLLCFGLAVSKNKMGEIEYIRLLGEMESIPEKIEKILEGNQPREIAELNANKQTFFYIGRRLNYPTALEGALKIKEISYLHAEAYPGGELKHGPLALLESGLPVICIIPNDELADKMFSNIAEVQARRAEVITLGEGQILDVPKIDPLLTPILNIVPLHLFAYHIAVLRGHDVDKPRNLAKSVTVE
ncbi:MAG: glutamine--fructose-6-phosphate transaminase (isomerizing) [Candidatus Altiarchaeota archaeon]